MRHSAFILSILASLTIAGPVAAQRATGAVAGIVSSGANTPVAGVTVKAQNLATGLRRDALTGPDGRYVIQGLPVEGEYEVSLELAVVVLLVYKGVRLVPNETLVLDFTLKVAAADQTVVTAAMSSVGQERSSIQETVDEPLVHELPLLGRNFIHLASLTAGFTGNPSFPSPQGQTYWTNNVLVDGASHFSKWRSAARAFYSGYGLESIREVQVLTNRFSAEFGEALASVTSAVTKAGTNEWHGSALLFWQDEAFNSIPAFAVRKAPLGVQQYGFTLGGPLAWDRTHFFGSYEGRRSRGHNIVVSPVATGRIVPDNEDEHLPFFRVDQQLGTRHLLMGRYSGQVFRWHNEIGGLALPGTGTHYTNNVQTGLVTDTFQISDRLLNESRFQFARYVDIRRDLQPTVLVSRAGYSLEGGTLGPLGFGADAEDTWEAADTLSLSRGPHALRFGGGLKHVGAHNMFQSYGRGAYFFAGSPEQFPQPFLFLQSVARTDDAAQADPRSVSAFGFIQEDWKVRPKLTLNLGLRYDVEKVSNVRGYFVPVDKDNVQPRVGAAWAPGGTGQTVVRGGVGLYTQQHLLFYINRVQLEGPDGAATIALSPDSPLFPAFPTTLAPLPQGGVLPPRDILRADAKFKSPYSLQATLGFERMLPGALLVAADYVHLGGRDLMSLVDANAPVSNTKPALRSVADADATRPITPQPGAFRKIVTLGSQGRSWYHALQIKATLSTGRLHAIASYTLSHAEDMANYELPEDSHNVLAERARANTDIRHNLAAGVTWELPGKRRFLNGWSLSGIGIFRSNRPYDITWGDDRNGTTQNDARPGARNTGKTDGYQSVDLALARRFRWGTRTLEARVEAFNVLNTTNFDEYVGALLSPLYARPASAFSKRRVQLGTIVRF